MRMGQLVPFHATAYYCCMPVFGSRLKNLRDQLRQVDSELHTLRAERDVVSSSTELISSRGSRYPASIDGSINYLERRQRELQSEWSCAVLKQRTYFALGISFIWGIIGVYAVVWLSNIKHPEWAFATTLAIFAILGWVSFIVSFIMHFMHVIDDY